MTEKDLEEFEKEFGFKLLPTSLKKPLSEITKEEYRERIEFLYNAIINDNSNDDDLMIEERIDELIKLYNRKINWCKGEKEGYKRSLIGELNGNSKIFIEKYARCILSFDDEIEMYESFIKSLEYAKTGERK